MLSQQWCSSLLLLFLLSSSLSTISTAEESTPKNVEKKLSDPSIKCDTCPCTTCELPPPPPPPPSPPPPVPCPPPPSPPPPKAPSSCIPCMAAAKPPPPPAFSYITTGPGNVYTSDPYGSDPYSGQKRGPIADVAVLSGLWGLIGAAMWA